MVCTCMAVTSLHVEGCNRHETAVCDGVVLSQAVGSCGPSESDVSESEVYVSLTVLSLKSVSLTSLSLKSM